MRIWCRRPSVSLRSYEQQKTSTKKKVSEEMLAAVPAWRWPSFCDGGRCRRVRFISFNRMHGGEAAQLKCFKCLCLKRGGSGSHRVTPGFSKHAHTRTPACQEEELKRGGGGQAPAHLENDFPRLDPATTQSPDNPGRERGPATRRRRDAVLTVAGSFTWGVEGRGW